MTTAPLGPNSFLIVMAPSLSFHQGAFSMIPVALTRTRDTPRPRCPLHAVYLAAAHRCAVGLGEKKRQGRPQGVFGEGGSRLAEAGRGGRPPASRLPPSQNTP